MMPSRASEYGMPGHVPCNRHWLSTETVYCNGHHEEQAGTLCGKLRLMRPCATLKQNILVVFVMFGESGRSCQ